MRIYVLFDRWGRMGNRMFQYAFGYLLAEKRNSSFYSGPLPNFNIPDTLTEKDTAASKPHIY